MKTCHFYPQLNPQVLRPMGITLMLLTTLIFFTGPNTFAQSKEDRKYFKSFDASGKQTMFKVNVSNLLLGEMSMGIERSHTLNFAYYGNLAWIHKSRTDMNAAGFGVSGGIRYYHRLPFQFLNISDEASFKSFTGNFVSLEGRAGMMHKIITLEKSGFDLKYTKIALHYGIQQTWRMFFVTAEIGPSWGSSDFEPSSHRRYYHNGWNLDGRLTAGIAF